ncbi:molecular chaperone [Vibrio fluvialis]|uniref:TorD/DmsD family molecular chaperone n=1 Tax=Vibrio fluvialis TaxID=676 RepID=UPI00292932BD|nr:molecular chaperone [Vibrio fluvialis]ELO1811900.1 molecular chaperone [Vibrio fluvialis]
MEHDSLNETTASMRSDIYLLLATLLRDAPSSSLVDFLSQLENENNGTPMADAWRALSAAAQTVERDELEQEYQELFIGIGRGEVVPFASWHLTGSLMEKPLAEIRFHLNELGLERDESVKEPEDHMAALCETMAYLCEGDDNAQQAFFNRHISPWFEKLVDQIQHAQHARFYLSVAQLLQAFLSLENIALTQAPPSRRNTHRIEVKNLTDKAQQ